MIQINLLPKEYGKRGAGFSLGKAGLYAIAGAAGVIVILISITFYQMHQLSQLESNIEKANQRAAMLREDIRVVDALIDIKEKIHRRITAVERLDRHRSAWVRILEDISRNVPEFVWLNKFTEMEPPVVKAKPGETGKTEESTDQSIAESIRSVRPVEIKGFAFSLNSLAAFMIKMMRSDYFDEVKLQDSRDTTFVDENAYTFILTANVHYLSDEEMRNLIVRVGSQPGTELTHKSLN